MELAVQDLAKRYVINKKSMAAVKNINLKVMNNEFLVIVGPSGCGKSTLLRMIAGLEEHDSGSITLDNNEVTGPSVNRGMVFQTYSLFPWLTVEENIQFGLKNKGLPLSKRKIISSGYIEKIGLKGFERHYPRQLSGGMRQRVAIARALANDPEILLLDEPFGALDSQTRLIMQELLLQIWEETRKTIIFVTHDIEEAVYLGSRVIVMSSKPGTIKKDITINIEHPRSYKIKTQQKFIQYKEKLTDLIREETLKSIQMEQESK